MKLKGINPFEQHIEKIVLGVAGAAFVGAMGYQFFVRGNDITVGSSKVPVSDAFRPAADAAKKLKDKVESPQPKMPEIAPVNLADRKSLGAAILPQVAGTARTAMGTAPGFGAASVAAVAVDAMFAPVSVPMPTAPRVAVHRATIHPAEVILVPELASLLPSEQPFDKASVGIEVAFDGTKLKAALEQDPDGNGPLLSMPLSWWRDGGRENAPMIEVLALEVERKTLRNADGSVPAKDEVVVLPAMPGRPAMLTEWTNNVRSPGDVPLELARVAEAAEQLQRPEFYSVISGPEWAPASEVVIAENTGGGREGVLRNQIRVNDQRIKRLEKELGMGQNRGPRGAGGPDIRMPGQDRDARDDRGRQPNSAGGGGGKGGARGAAPAGGAREETPGDERRAVQMRNLENWKKQRTTLQAELEKLTGKKEAPAVDASGEAKAPPGLLDNPNVRMWTSDLTALPGAVYAYRARVIINNPMFGRNLKEEQKALGEKNTLASEWTTWSTGTAVDRDGEFFVVSADAQSTMSGRATASAETYVFYYGYYRVATKSLSPGEPLSTSVKVPEMKLVNLDALRKDIEAGLEVPEIDPLVVPTPPGQKQPTTTEAGGSAAEPVNPLLGANAPTSLPKSIDAIFLGVRESLGANGMRNEAVIRDQDQTVRVMSPEAARTSELYKRMRASADAAAALLAERRSAQQPAAETPRPTPTRPREETPGRGGGGGGGGGGG